VTNITNITNVNNVNAGNRGVVVPPLAVHGGAGLRSGSNINLAMTNPRIRQAITSVSAEDFSRGATLNRHSGVDVAALQEAHVVAGNVPVVPERESLRSSTNSTVAAAPPVNVRNGEHFFVKTQPPAAPPAFNDQAARVQQVIRAHSPEIEAVTKANVGASAGTPGSAGQPAVRMMGPPEAQKTVQSGVSAPPPVVKMGPPEQQSQPPESVAKTGPPEQQQQQPPSSVSKMGPPVSNPGADNKTGQSWQKFGLPVSNPHSVPPVNGMSNGQQQPPSPVTKMGPPENSGTDSKNNQGWQKLGPPAGNQHPGPTESGTANGQQPPSTSMAKMGPPEQQQDKSGDSSKQKSGSDRKSSQGWQKFSPPSGNQHPGVSDTGGPNHQQQQMPPQQQQPPKENPPSQNNTPQDHNSWRKFPTNSDPGTQQSGGNTGKPPLDLRPPIVNPRPTNTVAPTPMPPTHVDMGHGSMGGGESRTSMPPPAPRIEPRMSPPSPAPHVEPRISPPAPAPHSEPSHGGGGGGDHGSSHSGGSSGGSHNSGSSDSKDSKSHGPH
jgi:hypothetical protein